MLTNIINTDPEFMNAYFGLWRVIRYLGDMRILLNFSYFTIRRAHSIEVTFEDWIKSYILYAKALTFNKRYEEALELLRNLLDIFANIPLEEIKFLSEIHKNNKISSTNNFVNFDYALSFYSKYHVYSKSESIFHLNYRLKTGKERFKLVSGNSPIADKQASAKRQLKRTFASQSFNVFNDGDAINNIDNSVIKYEIDNSIVGNSIERDIIHTNEENFDKLNIMQNQAFNNCKNSKESPYEDVKIEDIGVDDVNKLEDYIEKHIEHVEVPQEYTCK